MNLSNRCRLCMNEDKLLVNIFDPNDSTDLLSKMIVCLPVQITDEHSTISKYICVPCVRAVEEIYQFWRTVANNNHFFEPKKSPLSPASDSRVPDVQPGSTNLSQTLSATGSLAPTVLIQNIKTGGDAGQLKTIKLIQSQPITAINGTTNGISFIGKHKLSPVPIESNFKKFVAIRKLALNKIEVLPSGQLSKQNNCFVSVPVAGVSPRGSIVAAPMPQPTKIASRPNVPISPNSDPVIVLNDDNDDDNGNGDNDEVVVVPDSDDDLDDDDDDQQLQQQQQNTEENGFDFASLVLSNCRPHDDSEMSVQPKTSDNQQTIGEEQESIASQSQKKQSISEHGYSAQLIPECFDLTE